ncbi:condensation domain-containing protein, partial [Rhodanobacter sp. MP1X3]|uniref:condensation domain-containing protein n=1 Tax=Rhodanobacter sp. MP1X3 TaxID=2723086 RepID=UPI001616A4EC
MDGKQIYAIALEANVLLKLEDGVLTYKAADGIPDDLREIVRCNKDEVTRYLADLKDAPLAEHGLATRITRISDRGQLPVSRAQQRIWLAELQSANSSHFNIQGCFMVEGDLDPARVDTTLRQLTRQHEPLRTRFFEKSGRLHQHIHDHDEILLLSIDFSDMDPSSKESAVRSFVREDLWRPFDLAADALLRVTVLRLAADCHILVFNMHHIISDGWSVGLLMEEFCAAYASDATEPDAGDKPALQYGDFVAWQETGLRDNMLERGLRFWREYLAGIPQLNSLPIDRTRPARVSFQGERLRSVVDAALERRIRDYCIARRVTLFTFLQTALAVLLAHYGSDSDIVMGTPVAGRTSPETESIIGLFVNVVVLRTQVDMCATFDELLLANKDRILSAFEHQHVPFELVAENLAHKRSSSYSPIFQIWFVLQNNRQVEFSLPGCQISEYFDAPEPSAKHELNLYAQERNGTIELDWVFNTDVFLAKSIGYVAQQFLALLQNIVDRPDAVSFAHGLFDSSKRRAEAMVVPAAVGQVAVGGSILDAVQRHAAQYPESRAVVAKDHSVTYPELLHVLRGYVGAIRRHESKCVALLLDRGASMVAAMLAALSSGTPYVPLDPDYPPDRLRFMVEHANCDLLITSPSYAMLAASIAGTAAVVERGDDACDDFTFAAMDNDTTAYILYTSGSTGQPKGVFQSHAGLGYQAGSYVHALEIGRNDRILQLASYSFDASVLDTYGALLSGAELHLADVRLISRNDLWHRLSDERITVYHSTPTVFKQLFSVAPRNVAPCVRLIVMGGERVDEATVEVFRQVFGAECRLVGLYGATESSLATLNIDCLAGDPVGSLGRPILGTDVAVIRDDGTPARIFEVGQIAIRSRFIARGYWRDESLTVGRFLPADGNERIYLTGDAGYVLPDGSVRFTGRRDFQIKLNGIRIETGEIEARLLQLDVVARVAVVATSEPARLVAYVVPAAEILLGDAGTRTKAERQIAATCREALWRWLPTYMVPALFVFTDTLPLLPSGKIDRRALAALTVDARIDSDCAPPANVLESLLCHIWREVLSLAQIGVDDNLFDVGGTSMHSIRLRQEILDRTGLDVTVTDLFAYPTIRSLVRHLHGDSPAGVAKTGALSKVSQADRSDRSDSSIAIIGMAGRFPDAPDVEAFWSNIAGGVESLRVFTDEEMLTFGEDRELLAHPEYVKSGVLLDGLDLFDANYFGLNAREAEVTDPQQRLLFEAASAALEHAGYGDVSSPRRVGVYVGIGESRYLFDNLLPQASMLDAARVIAMHANRPAYAATRIAYSLNLSGPAMSIGTACSSSLVAVHSACVSLRNGECDMALAGGSSVTLLGPQGYLFQEGSIVSPDGHCRTFDSEARGTRSGSGAGLIVLKRLDEALADGDAIYAVIKGSASNNDGFDKVGYAAPSVSGQAQAIRDAHRVAGISPETVQYVEAHGTATPLGDPIEVAALTRAFGAAQRQRCALGSVKPNIGHLDSASGIAGLIKTVEAL